MLLEWRWADRSETSCILRTCLRLPIIPCSPVTAPKTCDSPTRRFHGSATVLHINKALDCTANFNSIIHRQSQSYYQSISGTHCYSFVTSFPSSPGKLSRYSDSLRAGRSGDHIPVGGKIFRTLPDRPWGPLSLLYNGYRVFPGRKEAGTWSWPTPMQHRG